MNLYFTLDNYFLDMTAKELYIFDNLIMSGDEALDYAFELEPPSNWSRVDDKPMLTSLRLEDESEYSYPY